MNITSRRIFESGLRPAWSRTVALSGLVAALIVAPAFADETADITKLFRAGQYAEALSKADAFLSKNPRDAQMRFLKGVILTEQNRPAEAITIFTKLTDDFPTLPEPYNNLAVLYAAGGQYDKARAALDAAIRTNPTYATAYENLGDVHAKLASQAYDKALQLDTSNSGAKSKLTLVRSLVGNINGGTNPKVAAAAPAAPATVKPAPESAPAPAQPAPAASTNNQVAAAAPGASAVRPSPAAPSAPIAAAKPEPVKKEPKPVPKEASKEPSKEVSKEASRNDDRDEVLDAVNDWAKAWSTQDMKGYLASYGNDFQAPGAQSRKAWEDERRLRIVGKSRINVRIEAPQVTVNGNTATVKFRQIYLSDQLTANTRKTLVLTKRGSKWQIKQERTGN